MNKEEMIFKAKKYFTGKTLDLFVKQIEMFNSYEKNNSNIYSIGDEVMLDGNTLIHGSRISVNELELIKNNGLVSPEFFKEYNPNKKKPFVVELWRIKEDILLKDFIDKYCGVTIDVKANDGSILKRIITSFSEIENELLKLEDYRDYIIYQNQEQRFMPNKFNKNSTMAFIVKDNEERHNLIKNDIFDENFDINITKDIVPEWFFEKYMLTREFDNYETGRERAILYGVPSSFIEGILVNEKIENDDESLKQIKEYFPECYICNLDGKVIY